MKALKISMLLFFALFAISLFVYPTDAVYTQSVNNAIAQTDTATTVGAMKKVRNTFDRIAQKYSDQWLPVYYVVYCDLEMIYRNPKSEENRILLDGVREKLDQLEKLKDVNRSELKNLWGYYYNAWIVTDPATYGQRYYNEVMSNYKRAIELDADNPRPVFLLAFFEQNLPSFLQSGKDYCGELRKSESGYNQKKNISGDIHWGKNFLTTLLSKCQ